MQIPTRQITLLLVVVALQSSAQTGRPAQSAPYFIPMGSLSARVPAGAASGSWLPYTTGGLSFTMPTTLPMISCFVGGEVGILVPRNGGYDIQAIHTEFGIKADLFRSGRKFGISPVAGLSSTMVGIHEGRLDIQLHTFRNVENEYGLFAGLSAWYRWKRIEVRLPVYVDRVLSFPQRFTTVVTRLQLGYRVQR